MLLLFFPQLNILKILTLLVHAGLFGCFHYNPPNSDMDYGILSVALGLSCCMRTHVVEVFTSTETVGLLGTGAQDVHLDFHTAPETSFLSCHVKDILNMVLNGNHKVY